MKVGSLKPFDDGKYLSEEEAMKLLESIPIPKDDLRSANFPQDKGSDLEYKVVDLNSADNGNLHSINGWFNYFAVGKETMVSMPDVYLAGKSGSQYLLRSLRTDFEKCWLITSTRIKYEYQQNARIVHHYGSQSVPSVEHRIVIPGYPPDSLANVLDTNEGLRYLQALFGTQDNAQQIKDTLQELSDYPLNKIKVRSVRLLDRPTESVSGLRYNNGRFNVYTDLVYHSFGRSRAVHINITPKSRGSP